MGSLGELLESASGWIQDVETGVLGVEDLVKDEADRPGETRQPGRRRPQRDDRQREPIEA
jgi:hypothetical protein